jgi:hypothetical protein
MRRSGSVIHGPTPSALAGLEGFLHHFLVTISAYNGYLDIEPRP